MKMTEPGCFAKLVLRGKLSSNVPMGKYTSWRAGGVAERMYQPADLNDLLVSSQPLGPVLHVFAVAKAVNRQADGLVQRPRVQSTACSIPSESSNDTRHRFTRVVIIFRFLFVYPVQVSRDTSRGSWPCAVP